jgi:hypothetical protein
MEGAGSYTVVATDTFKLINHNSIKLSAVDRAGRASHHAGCFFTVHAALLNHQSLHHHFISCSLNLIRIQVVEESRRIFISSGKGSFLGRILVPLLAGNLATTATDTFGGID